MKQGVELALNTVIIAAISLLVLVVVVIVFTGGFGDIIEKFTGIKNKVAGKADCVVIGGDDSNDKDNDGYHDSKKYEVTYKKDGKNEKLTCQCDAHKDNDKHQDDTDDLHIKHC